MATWRPMAPTPITVRSRGASTASGTSDSCRAKRLSVDGIGRLPQKVVVLGPKAIQPGISIQQSLSLEVDRRWVVLTLLSHYGRPRRLKSNALLVLLPPAFRI